MSTLRVWGLAIVLFAAFPSGCAYYATSHVPYTPLLDHAGQADVNVRTGFAYPGAIPIAVNAAVAVADGFEIVANGDLNVGAGARHYGGGIGIGTFVPTDVFRLELIGGLNGGYAEGVAQTLEGEGRIFDLSGGYLQPFGQLMLGFEVPHFVFAAGVRVQGFLSETTVVPRDGSGIGTTAYERAYAEPIIALQFPFDIVRFEVTSSLPIAIEGDLGPVTNTLDATIQFYLAAGVGFQWDAWGERERLPEDVPEPIYAPSYEPAYTPPPPAEPIPLETPTAPPTYETPPATSPPPPEPAPTEAPAEAEDTSPFRPATP